MRSAVDRSSGTALNRICPYFTMFPLRFPYGVLQRHGRPGQRVLDPFCGRGTTNYAARLHGLDNLGADSNPVAAAVAEAKVAHVGAASVEDTLDALLADLAEPQRLPDGEFWSLAFDRRVLAVLCSLREALLDNCDAPDRKALRAVILGALHGPLGKARPSYLSNQCPRTYGPKPDYAVRFWRTRGLRPPEVNLSEVLRPRIRRYFGQERTAGVGTIHRGDCRTVLSFLPKTEFDWVITSPPYYGMRTYVPDQWIRHWFLGGPTTPAYAHPGQLQHRSPEAFARELREVWVTAAQACRPGARLVLRFGGINDRKADPLSIARDSLADSGWRIQTVRRAGSASVGKRQADHFGAGRRHARAEFDIWARRS